jgi:magnesium transporter
VTPPTDNDPLASNRPGEAARSESAGVSTAPPAPLGSADDPTHDDYDAAVDRLLDEDAGAEELAPAVELQEGPDAADTIERLEREAQAELVQEMDDARAAEALAHMDPALAATVLLDLSPDDAARLLTMMEPDDAADELQNLPADVRTDILSRMHPKRAAVLGKLALYDPESAGGVMTTDILVIRVGMTIGQAIEQVKRLSLCEDQLDIYAVDDQKRLVGAISPYTLLRIDDAEKVADHLETDLDSTRPDVDREAVARIFERYDYLTMPVVDEHDRVLGMITIDDVIDVIQAEASEDALKQVGAGGRESVMSPVRAKVRGRTPWLFVNIFTASAAASVLLAFDDVIALIPVAAVIFPIIANQSGNAGFQSLAVTLRGLVLDEVRPERVRPLLLRETTFGFISGVLLGIFAAGVVAALGAAGTALGFEVFEAFTWRLGAVAGVALAVALAFSCFVGTAIPLLMRKVGFDPHAASSIFLIMLTDMLSFAAFLGLVVLLKSWVVSG